ncbi:MAG: nicotinate-nucleotide--dimethylbenzimidazole phosphoribosyltransferase, partial [Nitrospinota bacterium]
MKKIKETLKRIESIPQRLYADARRHLDRLAIPRRSLGRLEDIAQRYAAIKNLKVSPVRKKVIFTFAGDHGVVEEGVSAFPKEVTPQMVINFLRGGAGVNVLARHAGAEVVVIDIGVDYDFEPQQGLVIDKVGYGTGNIAKGPAMTYEQAVRSINIGIALMDKWREKGIDIAGTGDMGIGNTTPSSAILAAMSGRNIEDVTGRGTGIDDDGLKRKISTIKKAL